MFSKSSIGLFIILFSSTLLGQVKEDAINDSLYLERGIEYYTVNLDSTIYFLNKGVDYYKKTENWDNHLACLNALASINWVKGNFSESYQYSELAYQFTRDTSYHINRLGLGSALNNYAYYSMERGLYAESLSAYKEALLIESIDSNYLEITTLLHNLGNCLYRKGDYSESKRYYQQSLNLGLEHLDNSEINISNAYKDLAKVNQALGQIDTSIILYTKALDLLAKIDKKEKSITANEERVIHFSLAEVFKKRNEDEKFLKQINLAIEKAKLSYNKDQFRNYASLGDYHVKKKDYETAIKDFLTGLDFAKKQWVEFDQHPEIGQIYFQLSKAYRQMNNEKESLSNIELALYHYRLDSLSQSNIKEQDQIRIPIDPVLLNILKEKADQERSAYKKTGDSKFLSSSQQSYQFTISLLNKLRKSYQGKESKELLAQNVIPIFEGALNTYYQIYQQDQSSANFQRLFETAENSKSILLLESINELSAKGFGSIPESLLNQEKELKSNINYYEQLLNSIKLKDPVLKKTYEEELFAIEEEHRKLIGQFETEYPEYYQIKYDTKLAQVQGIQKNLAGTNKAMIEYFVGEEVRYAFYIDQQNTKVIKTNIMEGFDESIEELFQLISNYPSSDQAEKDFDSFVRNARKLHQDLIGSLEIPEGIKQLIIIPDDLISYIPFEILLTQQPKANKFSYSLNNLNYLVDSYSISYNYSASLLFQKNTKTTKPSREFLGFAPEFSKISLEAEQLRTCTLNQLHCSTEEVNSINTLFNGQVYIGQEANKNKFLDNLSNYNILHFATHSCLNDDNPMDNKIFFADGYISNYDLYNLELNTELAVLSACQTGTGVLKKGEGVMSLSRGFIHAGCPSLLMSLWSVEDCSTSNIMQEFYQQIKNDNTKDLALREAKLKHLSSANKLSQHPFFWAPFVQFGNAEAMTIGDQPSWILYLISALILGFAFYIFRNKSKPA